VCLEIVATTHHSTIFKLVYSVCIFINVSMYLCIYIATNQVAVYLDWLQAVHVSNPKSTRRRRPSELRDCYAFGVPVYFRDHTQSLDDAYIDT